MWIAARVSLKLWKTERTRILALNFLTASQTFRTPNALKPLWQHDLPLSTAHHHHRAPGHFGNIAARWSPHHACNSKGSSSCPREQNLSLHTWKSGSLKKSEESGWKELTLRLIRPSMFMSHEPNCWIYFTMHGDVFQNAVYTHNSGEHAISYYECIVSMIWTLTRSAHFLNICTWLLCIIV